MGTTPPDFNPLVFKESGSTSRIDNPSISISESRSVIQLPQELITDILVRLPVKSLLRFKCVSKPWLSLISNPQFIKSHFSRSSSTDEVENLELLFSTQTGMKKCCLYSALHEAHPSMHVSAIEFPAQKTHSIVGIINGLVCLNIKGTNLCIWNPAMNKMKYFNFHPQAPSGHGNVVVYYFSFGYDESIDDYKVVCLQTVEDDNDAKVWIYSLKAESWRRIDQLKGFYPRNPGVFAYGKIYWSGDLFGTPNGNVVSLDMSSEEFVESQPPKYDTGNCLLKMGVAGGRPIMFCDYYKEKKADLWVLDKRGVEESWTKLVSIPNTDVKPKIRVLDYRVLCILSSGEIVFGSACGLLVYDWKKKESRKIKLVVGIHFSWRTAAYVESLIWPDYA